MSTLRRTAATATDLACRATGRHQVVRAARFVLRRACLDVPNDLTSNGESSLQHWVLNMSSPGRRIHVIDVGANVGVWAVAMLAAAQLSFWQCADVNPGQTPHRGVLTSSPTSAHSLSDRLCE